MVRVSARHAEGHWFESSIAHVLNKGIDRRQKERALKKVLFFIRLYLMKKIILFTIFLSIIFTQDGRYERINHYTRFDTRTGETEYLSDGKWYTRQELSERASKLQSKQLNIFPKFQQSKIDFSLNLYKDDSTMPEDIYEKRRKKREKEAKERGAIYLDFRDPYASDVELETTNNSEWKIEEIDIIIEIFSDKEKTQLNRVEDITFRTHNDNDLKPGDWHRHRIDDGELMYWNEYYSWKVVEIRGYNYKNPPKLNWWE